jgi:TPR repeat protein
MLSLGGFAVLVCLIGGAVLYLGGQPNSQSSVSPETTAADAASQSNPPGVPEQITSPNGASPAQAPTPNVLELRNSGYTALVNHQYAQAIALFSDATNLGDSYAPMYLAYLYENGLGVPRDLAQASRWYSVAIN